MVDVHHDLITIRRTSFFRALLEKSFGDETQGIGPTRAPRFRGIAGRGFQQLDRAVDGLAHELRDLDGQDGVDGLLLVALVAELQVAIAVRRGGARGFLETLDFAVAPHRPLDMGGGAVKRNIKEDGLVFRRGHARHCPRIA